MNCEIAWQDRAEVGEGPVWDSSDGTLLWIDIGNNLIQRFDPVAHTNSAVVVEQGVSAAVFAKRGGLLIATTEGLAFATIDDGVADVEVITAVETSSSNRMNDGKCDPEGRFWVGSMTHDGSPASGSLYRVDPDLSVHPLLGGVGTGNGLGWSPDTSTMYFIDSPTRVVRVFDYDPASGEATDGRDMTLRLPNDVATPDGLSIDTDGNLWIALWEGSAVHCYAPDGSLLEVIEVPARRVTSCCFGGEGLTDLYITSAALDLTDAEIEATHAGSVFRARPGVAGVPVSGFAG
jgi:sugar lactone lactonase YvrE